MFKRSISFFSTCGADAGERKRMAGDGKSGFRGQTLFQCRQRTFANGYDSAADGAVQDMAVAVCIQLVIAETVHSVVFENQAAFGQLG